MRREKPYIRLKQLVFSFFAPDVAGLIKKTKKAIFPLSLPSLIGLHFDRRELVAVSVRIGVSRASGQHVDGKF